MPSASVLVVPLARMMNARLPLSRFGAAESGLVMLVPLSYTAYFLSPRMVSEPLVVVPLTT